jgi:uncharacterized repeat protein (TIGR01451 family)
LWCDVHGLTIGSQDVAARNRQSAANTQRGGHDMTAKHIFTRPLRRPARVFALGAAFAVAVLAIPSAYAVQGASKGNSNDKQTICHRTNSNTNPYVVNTPNKNGDVSGHARHTGPVWNPNLKAAKVKWGDIIPPFDYNNHGTPAHFAGLNWDATGQAFFANHCRVPITVTVTKTNDANGDGTFSGDETATAVGANVAFTVVVTNTSVVPVVLSTLVDAVAGSDVPFTCATSIIGSTLAAGASATCLFTLTGYSPADGGSVVDTVTATVHQVGNPSNGGSGSAQSTVRTAIPKVPDVSIVKTGPATAAPGDTITWTLVVHNDGNVALPDVVVTDTLPADTTLVSATGDGWTCTGTTDISCALGGDLALGGSSTVTLVATLSAAFTGTSISNTGVVTPNDVTPADNTSTATTAVTQPTAGGGGGGGGFTGGGGGTVTSPPRALPRTGASLQDQAAYGTALLLVGLGIILLTPRRRPITIR